MGNGDQVCLFVGPLRVPIRDRDAKVVEFSCKPHLVCLFLGRCRSILGVEDLFSAEPSDHQSDFFETHFFGQRLFQKL